MEQPLDFAVVVGLDDYPNFGSQGRPLKGAIADATRFAKWLKDTNTGGGLPERNCKEVLSTANPLGRAADSRGAPEVRNVSRLF